MEKSCWCKQRGRTLY